MCRGQKPNLLRRVSGIFRDPAGVLFGISQPDETVSGGICASVQQLRMWLSETRAPASVAHSCTITDPKIKIVRGNKMANEKATTFPGLRRFNGVMFVLHAAQAITMLVVGLTVEPIKDFRLPWNVSFLTYNETLQRLISQTDQVALVPVGALVSSFLFLSALAHLLIVLPGINSFYNKSLERKINYFRWYEYALSSSVMIVLIAMFFGVYDLGSLILIFGLNATMNLMGLMMELHNQTTEKTRWTAFNIGVFAGVIPWIIILMYFLGSGEFERIPGFVYAILISYFVLFNLFPVNMVLQYRGKGRWKNYLFGERGYIVLSLVAKSLLAWLVFAGTMQPA